MAQTGNVASVTVEWIAPPSCPSPSEVLAQVQHQLPSDTRSRRGHAMARVHRERAHYVMDLTLVLDGDAPAARRLSAASCDALVDAAALFIRLALEPRTSEPTPPAEATTAPAPVPMDAAIGGETPAPAADDTARQPPLVAAVSGRQGSATDASAERSTPWPLALRVGAFVRLGDGPLPQRPAWALQPRLMLSLGWLCAGIGVSAWLEGSTSGAQVNLRSRGVALDVSVGAQLSLLGVRWVAGVALEHLALSVEATGVRRPERQTVGATAVGGSLLASYRVLDPVEITLDLAALLPFSRPRWVIMTPSGDLALSASTWLDLRVSAGVTYVFQ